MTTAEEAGLVARAQRGEADAFAALARAQGPLTTPSGTLRVDDAGWSSGSSSGS